MQGWMTETVEHGNKNLLYRIYSIKRRGVYLIFSVSNASLFKGGVYFEIPFFNQWQQLL